MTPQETNITVVHAKRHEYDVYIGRGVYGLTESVWANPWKLPPDATPEEVAVCLKQYREYIENSVMRVTLLRQGFFLGKRVACWCKHEPDDPQNPPEVPICHGDVIRELQAKYYTGSVPEVPIPPPVVPVVVKKVVPLSGDSSAVISAEHRGDNVPFPDSSTITKRIIYREKVGVTPDGRKVMVCMAYNPETKTNKWFVCLIAVGGELYAMKSHGQIKTCQNVKRMAEGWERETATQLKKIQGSANFILFQASDKDALLEAIRGVWPDSVPQEGKQEIPAVHGATAANTRNAERREAAGKATAQKKKNGATAGIVDVPAVTPSLFD